MQTIAAIQRIETDRLVLRQWNESDFGDFARYYSDEHNARFVGGKKDVEGAWRHLALLIGHWHLKGFGYWAVEARSNGDFVGCVGLWQSPGWPELELGYWLMTRHQGKGYGVEAGLRAISAAREILEAPSLVSYIDPRNEPSMRLARRLGAVQEADIELSSYGTHGVFRHY